MLPVAVMDNRFPIFAALALVFCSFLTLSGMGQEFGHAHNEEWHLGNPFPGLGGASPSPTNPFLAVPQARMLYASEDANMPMLSPTMESGELYLARLPSGRRTGFFQKVNFNTLWVPVNDAKGLGMTELDLSAMFALPLPTPTSPLLLTPKFGTTFFDTKNAGSATLHTTGLGMQWIRPIFTDKLTAALGFSVFYSGDFRVRAGDALRFPAHIAGIWHFNPRTKIIFGVAFSDRKDNYNWFPMGGLIWTPSDDISVELLVPRIRIAQRVRWLDTSMESVPEDWLYTAFEFGSGTWGYEPVSGRVEYSDLRLLMGYERRTRFGLMLGLEVGYMFNREMKNFGAKYPSDSVFLRLRSSF